MKDLFKVHARWYWGCYFGLHVNAGRKDFPFTLWISPGFGTLELEVVNA